MGSQNRLFPYVYSEEGKRGVFCEHFSEYFKIFTELRIFPRTYKILKKASRQKSGRKNFQNLAHCTYNKAVHNFPSNPVCQISRQQSAAFNSAHSATFADKG